jgi:hypothetical protein
MGKSSRKKRAARKIEARLAAPSTPQRFVEKRFVRAGLIVAALAIVVLPLAFGLLRAATDPAVPFLAPAGEGQWIHLSRPFHLGIWKADEVVGYRRQLTVSQEIPVVRLTVRALRSAEVQLDGRVVLPATSAERWRDPASLELRGAFGPGPHELLIIVRNNNGPAALNAFSRELAIATGPEWEASIDRVAWGPVAPVGERGALELAEKFPTTFASFRDLLPFHLAVFVVGLLLVLLLPPLPERWAITPSRVRWLLIGALGLLAANNVSKIPLHVGFDIKGHYEYISYVATKGAIPLATEGWQMFQSPLYYLVSGALQFLLSGLFSAESFAYVLRIIPLTAGLVQVELVYRAVRIVFPERADLQIMGTVVGGLLPMNIYISQYVGNESLAGVLSATVIVIALGILHAETSPIPRRTLVVLGAVLGFAVLTKVTAAVLIPIMMLVLLHVTVRRGASVKVIVGATASVLLVVAVVSGWYYLRNWIELGRPFVGGWESDRQIVWWQDPGYRTIADFVSFGPSLSRPVFSAIYGFWDSLYSTFWLDGFVSSIIVYDYRPPWNYRLLFSGALLSLLPALGLLLGLVRAAVIRNGTRPGQLLSAYCVALYGSVLMALYLVVPIYSTAKATYTIGLIPCYAILTATGFDLLPKNRYLGATAKALLICWAVTVYSSYFVV